MKTGLTNILQFFSTPLSNSLFTVLFAYVFPFFLLILWLGICVDVDVDRITILTPPFPLPVFFLTHNSLFNTSDSYLKSVRA